MSYAVCQVTIVANLAGRSHVRNLDCRHVPPTCQEVLWTSAASQSRHVLPLAYVVYLFNARLERWPVHPNWPELRALRAEEDDRSI